MVSVRLAGRKSNSNIKQKVERKTTDRREHCKAAMIRATLSAHSQKKNPYLICSRVPFVFVCLNHPKVTLCRAEGKTKKSSMEINAAKTPVRSGGAAVIFKWPELFPLGGLLLTPRLHPPTPTPTPPAMRATSRIECENQTTLSN